MTTIQFCQEIQKCIAENHPLNQMIMNLYSTLLQQKPFKINGLTKQQSLSLVYEHLKNPLSKLRKQIEKIVQVKQNQIEEQKQQEIKQQHSQIQRNEDEQIELNQQENYGSQQLIDEQEEKVEDEGNLQQSVGNQNEQGSQNDVGLYGSEIDEEDMQPYENEQIDDDPQFANFKFINKDMKNDDKGPGQPDEYIDDNFDQFRQVLMQSNVKQREKVTEIQKQIGKLEERALLKKNWVLGGQVKAKERPVNSLLDAQLEFSSGIKYSHEITQQYNNSLSQIIKQRIVDEIFDDRVRFIPNNMGKKKKLEDVSREKSSKGLAQLYEIQFRNSLGLGDNTNDKLKKQIMDAMKELNYYLDTLSNTGFALKPQSRIQKNGSQALVVQNKVPITNWNGTTEVAQPKLTFESDKEINKRTKRLRNKRNARQRRKEQGRKKTNRLIQYGGITKFQAEARKKIAKTKQYAQNVKYSKSNSFFKNINQKIKPGKPNPNISKLKI